MHGRGDLAMQLRLLLRPHGVIGVTGAVAGASALGAAYLPWYQVRMEVSALGHTDAGAVATLPGWQAQPWGWIVPAVAVVAFVLAAAFAVDRPLRNTGDVQLGIGVLLALLAGLGAVAFPPVSRFDVAGSRLRELADVQLPSDVGMSFSVAPATGLWVTLSAAALLVVLGYAAREV